MLALNTVYFRERTPIKPRAHVTRYANSVNATIDRFATYNERISPPSPPTQKGHQTDLVAFAFWLLEQDSNLRQAD
jgi:hypothetical protein